MKAVGPIHLSDRFPELHEELIALLRGLGPEDWSRPTAAGAWTVKDIAAHLLDTDVRRLSFERDGMPPVPPDRPVEGYADLVGFLNQLNADWVRAARRISPRLLTDLLSVTGPEVSALFAGLDPFGPALFPVAWAGEAASQSWFDVAREYTEKWHHQQQIRDAVDAPPLTARRWLHPVLDTFLRALPHAYRSVAAEDGTAVVIEITGEAGDEWTLVRESSGWMLWQGAAEAPAAGLRMDQDTAWRRMTKGLTRDQAAARSAITGNADLARPMLDMLAVMA